MQAQTPAAASGDTSETIRLSPFNVEESSDVGYLAPNSLAGSRLNTNLEDIAASISVFTEEFISDLGATNLTDVLAYANNTVLELNDATNSAAPNNNVLVTGFQEFRVRGLADFGEHAGEVALRVEAVLLGAGDQAPKAGVAFGRLVVAGE